MALQGHKKDDLMQPPRIIPDYPNYTLTEDGKVFSRKTKRFLRPTVNKCVRLYNTYTSKQVSIAKLVKEHFAPTLPILPEQPAIDGRTTKVVLGYPDYTITATGKVFDTRRKCVQQPSSMGKIVLVNREERTSKITMVAQLVAETFIAPSPGPYTRIRHLDGNKKNNHADNLCWVQKGYICKPCPGCGQAHWYVAIHGYCPACQQNGRLKAIDEFEDCPMKTECLKNLENIMAQIGQPKSDS